MDARYKKIIKVFFKKTLKSIEILASIKISKDFEEKYVLLIKGPF